MDLFNKYKNKDFIYMINYINSCINDDNLSLDEQQIKNELLGDNQYTFTEFIEALFNNNPYELDPTLPNANILFKKAGKMLPVRDVEIPIMATYAEKCWLYYILQNPKTDLFISKELKNELLTKLESYKNSPISNKYIDFRGLSQDNNVSLTPDMLNNFKLIVKAIREHRHLIVTNKAYDGNIYPNQKVIPYKLEYSEKTDEFSLSSYPLKSKRPVKMNLENLSEISIAELVKDYDKFIIDYEKMISETKATLPIEIEVINEENAFDRCSYKFADYDKETYENKKGNLIIKIHYYRFQKDDIIRKILFLGHFVKVLSPASIQEEVINIIKDTYENYI